MNPKTIVETIEKGLLGQKMAIELAVCTFIAGGHLLIEDVPGVGKTTMARALAKAFGGKFTRIQFTSDLLPSDITGISVWNPKQQEFQFKQGPVFGNIVLSDEINRAPSKTQSALLEAMGEKQVSIDGIPQKLPDPFMVVATQNVTEQHGTYHLPESQLDRFMMRITLGYPDAEFERKVIERKNLDDPVDAVETVVSPQQLKSMIEQVDNIKVDESIVDFIMNIMHHSRKNDLLTLGIGPRGGMALHRAARAYAFLKQRDYCIVDDVKKLAIPVLSHRVMTTELIAGNGDNQGISDRIIRNIVDSCEVPL